MHEYFFKQFWMIGYMFMYTVDIPQRFKCGVHIHIPKSIEVHDLLHSSNVEHYD